MKKFLGFGKKIVGVFALGAAAATTAANAALTAPTIDTGDYSAIAGSILVAAGVFYGIRKAIRLLG